MSSFKSCFYQFFSFCQFSSSEDFDDYESFLYCKKSVENSPLKMPTLRDSRSDSLGAKSKYPTRRNRKNQQKTLKNQVRIQLGGHS